MGMSNAERQRRYRQRQKAQLRQLRRAQRPRSRPSAGWQPLKSSEPYRKSIKAG
jgi:hypothetical protein